MLLYQHSAPAMPSFRDLCFGLLLGASVGLLAVPVSAQTTRTVDRTLALERDGHVEIDTFTGRIEVTGWDRDSVRVEARIEAESPEYVEKTAIRFERDSRRLIIEADYEEVKDEQKFLGLFNVGNVDRPAVDFTVAMPRAASLTIDDFSSEIEVEGLRADVSLETFSSSVRLRDVAGTLDLETFSGTIEGTDLHGRVRLETFSGDVRLGMNSLTGNSRFETFSGDVELLLPADAEFELVGGEDAFGELSSEFDLRSEDGRRIAGEGGVQIEIETFSGDLRLRKK